MKVIRCSIILLFSTFVFASCHPNGRVLDHDTIEGSPSKADTVLPHKYKTNNANVEKEEGENVPNRLKR